MPIAIAIVALLVIGLIIECVRMMSRFWEWLEPILVHAILLTSIALVVVFVLVVIVSIGQVVFPVLVDRYRKRFPPFYATPEGLTFAARTDSRGRTARPPAPSESSVTGRPAGSFVPQTEQKATDQPAFSVDVGGGPVMLAFLDDTPLSFEQMRVAVTSWRKGLWRARARTVEFTAYRAEVTTPAFDLRNNVREEAAFQALKAVVRAPKDGATGRRFVDELTNGPLHAAEELVQLEITVVRATGSTEDEQVIAQDFGWIYVTQMKIEGDVAAGPTNEAQMVWGVFPVLAETNPAEVTPLLTSPELAEALRPPHPGGSSKKWIEGLRAASSAVAKLLDLSSVVHPEPVDHEEGKGHGPVIRRFRRTSA